MDDSVNNTLHLRTANKH